MDQNLPDRKVGLIPVFCLLFSILLLAYGAFLLIPKIIVIRQKGMFVEPKGMFVGLVEPRGIPRPGISQAIEDFINIGSSNHIAFSEADNLKEFPLELLRVAYNLERLIIEKGKFASLPPEISQLTLLTRLDVHDSELTFLDPEIGKLQNLKILLLYNNKISFLPPEIGNLKNLEVIDLRDNQLTFLPEEIGNLVLLRRLLLGGNPISEAEIEKIKSLLPTTNIIF